MTVSIITQSPQIAHFKWVILRQVKYISIKQLGRKMKRVEEGGRVRELVKREKEEGGGEGRDRKGREGRAGKKSPV